MKFSPAALEGVWLIESEQNADERGYFMRAFCAVEFRDHGLPERFVQASVSSSDRVGTVRGLHFQWPPSREGKLIRCLSGAIYDVLVDLRPSSKTFMQHCAVPLSEKNALAVYVPEGLAHGFQVREDGTRVLYQMTDVFQPSLATGVFYADPVFGIRWPEPVTVVSERDRSAPPFDRQSYEAEFDRRTSGAARLR
jgi:dTDP-4-dehydrorhamnose 3,5-epimerase